MNTPTPPLNPAALGDLYEALYNARSAIASLGEFDLGGVDIIDPFTGDFTDWRMEDGMSDSLRISDVLERAADLIEPEGAWTRCVDARDQNGDEVDPCDPDAVCWCAGGAMLAATPDEFPNDPFDLFCEVAKVKWPYEFNDEHPQSEVVSKLREAAALAREKGL